MNSILQCLFSVGPLLAYFAAGSFKSDLNPSSCNKGLLARAFADIAREAMDADGAHPPVIAPSALKRQVERWAPQFAGYDQHDAQEFMRFLLDGLHEETNRGSPTRFTYTDAEFDALSDAEKATVSWNRYLRFNSSFIFDLFGGQLESTVTCLACGHKSVTYDAFWDLSVPVAAAHAGRPSAPFASLCDCLDAYFAQELLDEGYRCDACKVPRPAKKRLRVMRAPHVLVVHLKRFSVSPISGLPERKLDTPISFPLDLLSLDPFASSLAPPPSHAQHHPYAQSPSPPSSGPQSPHPCILASPVSVPGTPPSPVSPVSAFAAPLSAPASAAASRAQTPHARRPWTYSLVAISNHSGSLGGGHYTAITKSFDDLEWYSKNDSSATRASTSSAAACASSAYILFYQRTPA
ncbi:hypothetical protein HK105_205225 [Polyrhizophydium stewartii]|uniref:USP domain-containing protein n=1 Tax=Polyrhizophydium stewartii TaxID=2732419 RepID=A0ABR4N786_9FUNG|nr:hypothetical protein HK105_007472 [Polyrhizophydium stewartii]